MLRIKRYSNRKLYDCNARCYLTLEEIGAAVRSGEDIQVIDHASNADLTTLTMVQVLLAEEKRQGGWLPHQVLARLIRAGENSLENLREAFQASLDPAGSFEREIHRRVQRLVQEEKLTAEESNQWVELLLSPELESQALFPGMIDEPASRNDIHILLAQLEQIDQSLADLK